MADPPEERLYPDIPPFSHVGMVYFGPTEVRKRQSSGETVGSHLHLPGESSYPFGDVKLSNHSCINAIRRFICRRGTVLSIRTDCRTNFVGAQRELQEALKELNHQKIQNTLLTEGEKWTFKPPFGAHHVGVWERLIRLVLKNPHI